MNLKVKYLPNYNKKEWGEVKFEKPRDSGFDLRVALPYAITIAPGDTVFLPTGIAVQLPEGFEIQVRPRSSWSKAGFHVALGTVDSGYRGEIKVVMTSMSKDKSYQLLPGKRIAQAVVCFKPQVFFVTVDELDPSERGEGGFGSTGAF